MKYRLIELLKCPKCNGNLKLHVFDSEKQELVKDSGINTPHCSQFCGLYNISINNNTLNQFNENTCKNCFSEEIQDGLFTCSCGSYYPIVKAIPNFVETNLDYFPDYKSKYIEQLKNIIPNEFTKKTIDEYDDIRSSFSEEWSMFEYDKDKTWGWNLDQRKEIFLNDISLNKDDVKGKLLLDAGCGNGSMTAALSTMQMEVVGMDIHNGLNRAYKAKIEIAKNTSHLVHYVQGNLFEPPFKNNSYDLIYSSGVIHHTPSSEGTFNKIYPLIKTDGRVYVWVYGQRPLPVVAFQWAGRQLRKRVSLKTLYYFCKVISPVYKIACEFLNLLGVYSFRKRTTREITLDLFDAFSPQFNHRHKESEVMDWFKKRNFRNVNLSGIQKHGFGVFGDMNPSV